MLSLLFSLTVTLPALQEPTPGDCDEVCAAVLEAALDWTLAQVEEIEMADPERLFLDVTPNRDENAAHEAQRAVVRGLVESMDLPALERREHPAWRACAEAHNSGACRAGVGVTGVGVQWVEVVSPTEAVAWSRLSVLGGPGRSDVRQLVQLHLERVEGVWRMARLGDMIVS